MPYSTAKRTGSKGFRFYYNTNPPQYLISKELSIPSNALGVNVTFWYKNYSTSNPETFQVGYSTTTNSTSAFTWDTELTASNAQWTKYANSTPFPAGTKHIAIRYNSNDKFYLFIDDLEITYTVATSCPKPKNLAAGFVGDKTASFSWTAGGEEDSWEYVYLPASTELTDEAWEGATAGSISTNPAVTISNLSVSTNYVLYVRANCGSSYSTAISKAFTTACEAKEVPFKEDFNNAVSTNYAIPECWSRIAYVSGSSSYPYVNGAQGVDGSKGLYFYGGASTTSSIIVLPLLDAPTNTLAISFDYKQTQTNASYYGQAKIGYITDPTNVATFQVLKALDRKDAWTSVEEELLTGAPANSYIAIQFAGTGSSNCYLSIDNIEVAVPASCKKPGNLTVGATSPTSLKASWTAKGEETAWNVRFSTDGVNWTTRAAETNPFVLTGLTAGTTYEVQVQANCGGELSQWTSSKSATTLCAPINGIGFSQNFDSETSNQLPSCWSKISSSNYPYTYNFYANGCTGKCFYFYGGVDESSELIAILPPFNEATNTLFVTLSYSNSTEECNGWYDYSTSNYGQLEIGFITDPTDASTFTAQKKLERVNVYTQEQVALINASADSYVAIRYAGGSLTGEAFVDDIAISAIPSCLTPSDLAANTLSTTSAEISWSSTASKWNLRYSLKGDDAWTTINDITQNPCTLSTGLVASKDYEIQIQTVCGEEEASDWSSSTYFSMPCDVASMPFSQNFNGLTSAGQIPTCWNNDEGSTTEPTYKWSYNASGHEGACVRFDSYNNYSENDNYLKTPEIAINETAILNFWYKNPAGGDFSVYYSLDGGATLNSLATGLTGKSAWTKHADIELPSACVGQNVTIIFKGTSNYAYGEAFISLDDVIVMAKPSCVAPAAPVVSSVTATTAELTWTAGGEESAWLLQYSTNGQNWVDANNGEEINTNSFTLEDLTPNHTTYYARVKAVCGVGDESVWSDASEPFETACAAVNMPFSEDFNADINCWKKVDCESGTGLNNNTFMFKYGYASQYLITPEINTQSKKVTVEFDYYVNSTPETFKVGYSTTTNEVSAFSWSETINATNVGASNVLRYSDNLPAGVKYVSIQYTSYDKYYLFIDNFSVEEAPACPKVKASTLAASNITANSATVAWTKAGEETAWNLQFKAEGEDWSDVIPVATTPSHDFDNLAANTVYYVRVQADCAGEGTSEYTDGTFFFATECEALSVAYGNEWEFGFEGEEGAAVNTVPACWNQQCSTDEVTYAYALVDNAGAKTGSQCLHIEVYHNYNAIAVLPTFSNDLKDLQISFAYKNEQTTTSYGQLEVGYYLNGTFSRIGDKLTRKTTYTDMKVEMPEDAPVGAKMAFRVVGSGGYRRTHAYIDDVVVSKKPIVLADNVNNADTLGKLNGKTVDVVIGRKIVRKGYYNTICLPFSLSAEEFAASPIATDDLWAFRYAKVDEATDELLFRIIESDHIEAGVPYFIGFEENEEDIVNPLFKNVTISATEGQKIGDASVAQLCGIVEKPVVFNKGDQSKLFLAANNTLYWWAGDADSKLNNFRAYFKVATSSANGAPRFGMPARIVKEHNSTTGVDEINGQNAEAMKILENKQVVIIRNGVKYNVQGQVIR